MASSADINHGQHLYEGPWDHHSRECWCWKLEDTYAGPCLRGE